MKHLASYFLLSLLPCLPAAQEMAGYVFRHLGPEDGLAGAVVINMLQDRQGFIWISCHLDGLQRYDGERFLLFQNDHADSTSIPYGLAWTLFEDSRGTIWCAVGQKRIAAAYDPDTRQFRRLRYEGNTLEGVFQFFEINGRVYMLSLAGVLRLDDTGSTVEIIAGCPSSVTSVGTLDAAGRIWLWCDKGYHCFDVANGQLYHVGNNPFRWKIFDEINHKAGPRAFYCDQQGNIWISDWNDGYRFDFRSNKLTRYRIADWGAGSVSIFLEDDHKRLWAISGWRRLCRYVPEADSFVCLTTRNEDPYAYHSGLSGEEYPTAIKDREGYFWVGNDRGVHIFHPTRQPVRTIKDIPESPAENSLVNDIFQAANGDIYVSHWIKRMQRFDSNLREKEIFRDTPRSKFWKYQGIYSVEQDVYGRIWVGEEYGWITLLDAEGRKLSPMRCKPCDESRMRNILRARNGDMWINLRKPAIARWDFKTRQFEVYDIPKMRPNFHSYSLLEDDRGNIWVGTYGEGLYCFDPVAKKFTARYYDNSSWETELWDNSILALYQLSADTLLVGAEHGLKYLDLKNGVFRPHPLSAAFPNKYIFGILQDQRGNVWFMTGKGIFCADRALTRLRSFGISEGFVEDNFAARGFIALRDGRFAAGTREGSMVVFHPDSLLQAGPPLLVPVIMGFEVFGKPVLIDSLLRKGQPVMLDHDQNAVTIFFGVLSYGRSGLRYEYRLLGLNDHWADAGEQREANLSYLPPGAYTFEVRAVDYNGNFSPVTSLGLVIRPPWYQTWWFYALLTLTLLGIAYAVARARIRRFRERATYEKRLADLQNQALRAQINPHFIFNALQSVKRFVLENDVEQAEHYMSRFARLMRQIMDNSREATVSLRKELDLLDNYLQLEQLRFGHSFDYRFELEPDVHPDDLVTPSMTLQPFVENAVLHGLAHLRERSGLLLVRCKQQNGDLLIEIEDNGVGRARAEELKNPLRRQHHRSAGTDITRKRLALFGDEARFEIHDLHDEAGNACGTRVEIWLPEG